MRSSLVPHAVLLTHPRTMKCTLVVSQHRQKAVCKSRPGNLLSGTWCFWIVHECTYHPFGLKGQWFAFSKWHEQIKSTREAQTAMRSSLVPHAVLLTHPRTMKCTLVVSQHRQKAVCKSRPGNLLSGAWCF